jgi:hypothetical protein
MTEMYIGSLEFRKGVGGSGDMEARSIALERISIFYFTSSSKLLSLLLFSTLYNPAIIVDGFPLWDKRYGVLVACYQSEAQPSNVALELMTFNIAATVTRSTRLV